MNVETNGITAEFCTTKCSELSSSVPDGSITICAKQVATAYAAYPTKKFYNEQQGTKQMSKKEI